MDPVQVLELGLDMKNQYYMAMDVDATECRAMERDNRGFRSRGLTLHSDEAMDQVDGTTRVGAGFIIRRSNGGFLCAAGRKMQCCASVEEAELRALVWALVYCDKEHIILTNIYLDNQWINCQAIDFCPRETNRTAHWIAQTAKRMVDEMIEWKDLSELPVLIQKAVDNDRNMFLSQEG
ncbi:Uncharacterized protein TCM_002155 [Theobroma cacao]|uniref:RNase H type-1 domain-containing protein n=1 Tax=Theobroma cacao TaxID=3641 RepID=A0A061DTL1_THECC|nr:Uncharacterized protein TCM_002155 [Theobroma cacao]